MKILSPLLYAILFATGAAALSVEVVWSRMVHRLLGSGATSSAIVLGSFLAGMGLGAFLAERGIVRRASAIAKRPLLLFAGIEAGAAVLAVLATALFAFLPDLFRGGGGELFAAIVLTIATLPLGAGFPVLLTALETGDARPVRVRRLYAANALGGGLGALLAGLALIPLLGEHVALGCGVTVQLIAAAVVAVLGRRVRVSTEAEVETNGSSASLSRAGAAFVFLSGFVVFFWEILWMRIFVLTVGATVYAFATVAASVVIGIGIGSLVFGGRVLGKSGAWVLPLAVLVTTAIAYVLVPELASAYVFGVRSFGLDPLVCGTLGASLIAFVPNLLLGALFPWFLASRIESAGSLYGVNALGSILGAALAGPILAGLVPLEATFRIGLVALALLLVVGLQLLRVRPGLWTAAIVLGIVGAADGLISSGRDSAGFWDWTKLLRGVYQWSHERLEIADLEEDSGRRIVAIVEGREVIVTAEREERNNVLWIKGNGKVEGSVPIDRLKTSTADMPTQLLLGAAGGILSRKDPESPSLLIGLGSGVTLGAFQEMRKLCQVTGRLDVIEIEPGFLEVISQEGVVESIRPWFDPASLDEKSARVNLRFGDARRLLSEGLKHEKYSVIVSQPAEPWVVGAAPLFTVEFFEEARGQLANDGVFVQWVQLYRIDEKAVFSLLKTFQEVFPHLIVLRPPGAGELILLGSPEEIDFASFLDAPVFEGERQVRSGISSGTGWAVAFIAGTEGVREWDIRRFPYYGPPLNRDTNGYLEFVAPRSLDHGIDVARRNLASLRALGEKDPVTRYLPEDRCIPEFRRTLARGNLVLGDLDEAEAILVGDSSPEADAIREEIAGKRSER